MEDGLAKEATVSDPRGLKRICTNCGTRFFDLNKRPIVCPQCETEFTGEVKIKNRRGRLAADDTTEDDQVSEAKEADEEDLVDDETVFAVCLAHARLGHLDDDAVGNQCAGIHEFFRFEAQRGAGFDFGAQHVSGRDLRHLVTFSEITGLGAFAGSGHAEKNNAHHDGFAAARGDRIIIPRYAQGYSGGPDQFSDVFEVGWRIDAGVRGIFGHHDADAVAMPERAQLFEGFDLLNGGRGEPGVRGQETRPIRVNADMAECRQVRRQVCNAIGKRITREGYGGTAEIHCVACLVADDFDYIGVGHLRGVGQRATGGCDRRIRVCCEVVCDPADQTRRNQRLVALHIDDDCVIGKALRRRDFGDAVGARSMVRTRHHCRAAMRLCGAHDISVISGDNDFRRTTLPRAICDMRDHRLAADVEERFARQAGRRKTRGDDDDEIRHSEFTIQSEVS